VNRAGPAVHGASPPPLVPLTVGDVEAAADDGARAVDVRAIERYAAGHVPGSLSIRWRAQFATWLGWLVSREQPVVFVTDDGLDRADLAWAAYTVGHERLVGELAGGIDAWQSAGRALTATALVGPDGADGRRVLDVRQRSEFAAGHLPGAHLVELGQLTDPAFVVPGGPVLVHCGHGERAMSAARLLERGGHRDVAVLAGGPDDLGQLEVGA
jgi:hydroxyacylglutathione hydrolase